MYALSTVVMPPRHAEILGLEPGESDPVRIILAAHLRLRSCRRGLTVDERCVRPHKVRQIVAARDALLQKAVGALASRGLGGVLAE